MASGIVINGDGTATWTITAADTTSLPLGPIRSRFKIWRPFIPRLASLYGYWPLDEAAGNPRLKSTGNAVVADLPEENGTVATGAGKFGLCVQSDPANNHWLRTTTLDPTLGLSSGLTAALLVNLDAYAGGLPNNTWALSDGGTHVVYFDRFGDSLFVALRVPPRIVTFTGVSESAWHLIAVRYDPLTKIMSGKLDNGAFVPTAALSAAEEAANTGFSSLGLTNVWHGGYTRFPGRCDALMIWTAALTDYECSGLWTNPNQPEEIEGDIISLDSSTTLTPTGATWGTTPTLTLTESRLTQGGAFTSVLSLLDTDGSQIDLTGYTIDWRLFYEPEGSSTEIPFILPTHAIVAGHVYYTDYKDGFPRPILPWPGVTVTLSDGTFGSTVTDANGAYSFTDPAPDGTSMYVSVTAGSAQIPPGQTSIEVGNSANFNLVLGETTIDLTCVGGG